MDKQLPLANSQYPQPFFPLHATIWLSADCLDRPTITPQLVGDLADQAGGLEFANKSINHLPVDVTRSNLTFARPAGKARQTIAHFGFFRLGQQRGPAFAELNSCGLDDWQQTRCVDCRRQVTLQVGPSLA